LLSLPFLLGEVYFSPSSSLVKPEVGLVTGGVVGNGGCVGGRDVEIGDVKMAFRFINNKTLCLFHF
jgi:hypothetical protein